MLNAWPVITAGRTRTSTAQPTGCPKPSGAACAEPLGLDPQDVHHLLWGDQMWMSWLTGSARSPVGIADSRSLSADWTALKGERVHFDQTIIGWADTIAPSWLAAEMTYYSLAVQRDVTEAHWVPVTHLFNHQTHHRGQVHYMLTQAGERPADTDLPFMPE